MEKREFIDIRELYSGLVDPQIDKLLALGCGNMRHELELGAKNIFGIEWSDERLNVAKNKENVIVIKYDITEIENIIPDKSFDSVCMFDVLEHLEKDKALHLLKVLDRIVKKQIILYIPIQKPNINVNKLIQKQKEAKDANINLGEHISYWTPEELDSLGFTGYYSEFRHYPRVEMGAVFCVKNIKTI